MRGIVPVCALTIAIQSFALPAVAEPYLYKNALCPVEITFPEAPDISKTCAPDAPEICHEVATYRFIKAIDELIDIKVACQIDSSKKIPDDKALVQSLQILLTDTRMRQYNGDVVLHGPIKQAVFMGLREEKDKTLSTVIGNLWIDKGWRFTVVAEHVGTNSDELEKQFFSIVKSQRVTPDLKAE